MTVGPLAEDGNDTVSAALTVTNGTLHVGSLSGVTVSNNGTASVTVSGSAANVNTVLAGLTYTPTTEYEGSDTLNVTVTSIDGSNTSATHGTASTNITVNPLAEGPVLGGATSVTVAMGGLVTLGVTEAKFDADDTLGNVTITGLPHDLTDFSGGTYTAGSGTWTGTAAQFTALTFAAGSTTGTFALSISAPNTTPGEAATATENYTLTITSAEGTELPILGGATSATVNEGGLVTLGVTEAKFDSDDTLGTVTITGLPGDLSNFSGGTYTAGTGTWTGTAAQFTALTFNAGDTAGTFTLSISAPNTTAGEAATATENYTLTVNTPPVAPVITGFTTDSGTVGDHITNDTLLTINGTAAANSTVAVFQGVLPIGTATAGGSGNWSVADSNTLVNGTTYQFTATATDATGHTSVPSASYAATIDNTAPNAPTGLGHSGSSTVSWSLGSDNSGGSGVDHYLYQVDSGTRTTPNGSYTSTTSTSGTWTNPSGSQSWTLFVETVDIVNGNVSAASSLQFNACAGIGQAWADQPGFDRSVGRGRADDHHDQRDAGGLEPEQGHKQRQRHVDGRDERPQRADGHDGRRLCRSHGARRDRDLDQRGRQHRNRLRVGQRRSLCAGLADLRLVGRRHADRRGRKRPVRLRAADRQRHDLQFQRNVTDKIDLTGFAGIASFGDIAGHIADAGNGDAIITLGAGETITLHGVDAASLTAADFVFNQTPVVENAGTMVVSDGAMLPLGGTIDNTGTIALNSTGDETDLQIIGDGVTLQGGGHLTLSDSHENVIFGATAASTLTNVDNTISGAGQIGIGDNTLTLINETAGTIDGNASGHALSPRYRQQRCHELRDDRGDRRR